ncbi:UNVERIFIED_CONTAM: Gfo/Idh/MocA family oxidoreductase [Microbacterium sp. SLM126]
MRTTDGLTMAVAGAGARGFAYAEAAGQLADPVRVVAVAEPRPAQRRRFLEEFDVSGDGAFADWRDLAAQPRLADIMVISLLDDQHVDAAIAFAAQGYDILLEKPMATNEEDCVRIVEAVEAAGVRLAVGHVLRYTPFTLALQDILREGAIGDIVNIDHLEPIGHWHFAHSFVRGNWRREDESSSLLLQKSCHDIDWLMAIVDRPIERVSSFGSLTHFRAESRPEGASDRCFTCAIEPTCPFSALRFYRRGVSDSPGPGEDYMARVMAGELTPEAVEHALEFGPYGRCVYASDNDVVDHQVVVMEFEGAVTVSFTLSALSEGSHRKTRIFGTKGQITADGQYIHVYDFLTGETRTVDTDAMGHAASDGHAGGDIGLVRAFVGALRVGDRDELASGARESLSSHRVVFAAERARRSGTIVQMDLQPAPLLAR